MKVIANRFFQLKEHRLLIGLAFSLPSYFILDANSQFLGIIPISVSLEILCHLFFCALFFFFSLSFFINPFKAAVLLTIYLVWYLFFKTIQVKFSELQLLSFLKNPRYYFGFSVVLLLIVTWRVCVLKEAETKKVSKYLNFLFIILFCFEVCKISFKCIKNGNYRTEDIVKIKAVAAQSRPDIYLIVMDEYAGIQSAKDKFDYDNKDFIKKLISDSFFVAKKSNSNYNATLFSIASMLNLNYSKNFDSIALENMSAFGRAANEIHDNRLIPFLTTQGYCIKNFSGFAILNSKSIDFYFMKVEKQLILYKTFGNVLRLSIIGRIPSNSLQRFLGSHSARVDEYNTKVYDLILNELNSKKGKQPEFLYAHFLMPHAPFLKRNDGTTRKYSDALIDWKKDTYGSFYVEYMQYVNSRMEYLIDQIKKREGEKIIILVSDHGERIIESKGKLHAFNNFFAVYDTKKNYKGFSDTFALVNTFRVVLNNYFSQNLPLLNNERLDAFQGKAVYQY